MSACFAFFHKCVIAECANLVYLIFGYGGKPNTSNKKKKQHKENHSW